MSLATPRIRTSNYLYRFPDPFPDPEFGQSLSGILFEITSITCRKKACPKRGLEALHWQLQESEHQLPIPFPQTPSPTLNLDSRRSNSCDYSITSFSGKIHSSPSYLPSCFYRERLWSPETQLRGHAAKFLFDG